MGQASRIFLLLHQHFHLRHLQNMRCHLRLHHWNLKCSRETASWPFSLCLKIFHMTGLISGALSTYFTTRSICIAGCFVAAIGASLCYFTTSIFQVAILIGVVKGLGMGLSGTQTPEIINQYFDRHRATVRGIVLAGDFIYMCSCIQCQVNSIPRTKPTFSRTRSSIHRARASKWRRPKPMWHPVAHKFHLLGG